MEIAMELVRDLRQRTGAGVMDCRTALQEAKGDLEGAIDYLRRKGLATAAKKAGRIATVSQFSATDIAKQYNVPAGKIDVRRKHFYFHLSAFIDGLHDLVRIMDIHAQCCGHKFYREMRLEVCCLV